MAKELKAEKIKRQQKTIYGTKRLNQHNKKQERDHALIKALPRDDLWSPHEEYHGNGTALRIEPRLDFRRPPGQSGRIWKGQGLFRKLTCQGCCQ